jgi:hypothetical protein
MRRCGSFVLLVALAAGACSSGGRNASTTTTQAPLPPQLTAFLADVKPQGTVAFRATYHVLRKLGGVETDVRVQSTPPRWTVTAGGVSVGGPPAPTSGDEARLSAIGIFSSFYAEGPARALVADARRATAGAPVFSDRVVAGVPVHCVAVPQAGVLTQTACLTPDGVFGFLENASVRYELTSYEVGPS